MNEETKIDRLLKAIEHRLDAIQVIKNNRCDKFGEKRTIKNSYSIKEAMTLLEKVMEAQAVIDRIEDPTAHYVYQDQLDKAEQERRKIIFPATVVIYGSQ